LREEWVRPEEIIKETSRRLRERLRAHKLNIIPSDVDMEVAMDTIMVSQVLQNLLDNAAKYTAAGTQIDVSWEANENGFFLTIRDHGHGIPDDAVGKVFDKYARIKRQDRQVAGTGLGLAIAKAVMLAQEGGISAANHPDGGAVFTLTLPKVRIHGKKKAA
jgi:two-component system sensor histidine kinase KdpD